MIIIDTVAGICNEFITNSRGTSNLNVIERSTFLRNFVTQLKLLSSRHNLAVVVGNNMTSSVNDEAEYFKKEKVLC